MLLGLSLRLVELTFIFSRGSYHKCSFLILINRGNNMSNYKKVEGLLKNYRMYKCYIDNIKNEIDFIRSRCGTGEVDYEFSGGLTNAISSITEAQAIQNIEDIEKLEEELKVLEYNLDKIDKCIECLDDIEKAIVTKYYIEGQQWFEIAYEYKYSERHCKRIRTAAINSISVGMYRE